MSFQEMTPPSGLKQGDFSMMACRIAQIAATWAADVVVLPEGRGEIMAEADVARFLREARGKLDWMEDRANGKHR